MQVVRIVFLSVWRGDSVRNKMRWDVIDIYSYLVEKIGDLIMTTVSLLELEVRKLKPESRNETQTKTNSSAGTLNL